MTKLHFFQLSRSLTASTLTAVTETSTTLETSSESCANVAVIAIDNDKRQEQMSPSVDRY